MVKSGMQKLAQKYNDTGFLGLLILIIRRIHVFRYFVVFYFYRVPLEALIRDIKYPPNISVKVIKSPEEIDEILKVQNKRNIFLSRLEKGVFAVLLYFDGIPVGYVWGQLHSPHYEERYGFLIELGKEDVYDFDSYIDASFRGLGLRKYLLKEFVDFALYNHNKFNMTAIIEKDNLNSIKVHEGMGYRRANLQVAFKIFSRDFQFVLRKYK